MAGSKVVVLFTLASILMWTLPIGVLLVLNWNLIPGLESLSPQSRTLWSGAMAVFCVNLVIVAYICLALIESTPATNPEPDPEFLRKAKESVASVIENPSTPGQRTAKVELEEDKRRKID